MNNDYKYMKFALEEAYKAFNKNEIPVGAVIVLEDKIIAEAHNLKDSTGIVINHAEILAIQKANKVINDWRLNGAIMYVTLKPCPMCASAIQQARISKVIYGTSSNNNYNNQLTNMIFNDNNTNHKVIFEKSNCFNDECKLIIDTFFKKIILIFLSYVFLFLY